MLVCPGFFLMTHRQERLPKWSLAKCLSFLSSLELSSRFPLSHLLATRQLLGGSSFPGEEVFPLLHSYLWDCNGVSGGYKQI